MKEKLIELAELIQEHAKQIDDVKLIELANQLSKEVVAPTDDTGGSNPPPSKERP